MSSLMLLNTKIVRSNWSSWTKNWLKFYSPIWLEFSWAALPRSFCTPLLDIIHLYTQRILVNWSWFTESYPIGIGDSFPGDKAAGKWSWPLHPSSTEVKNAWSYTSTPQYFFLEWCLVKYRDNFTVTITYTYV